MNATSPCNIYEYESRKTCESKTIFKYKEYVVPNRVTRHSNAHSLKPCDALEKDRCNSLQGKFLPVKKNCTHDASELCLGNGMCGTSTLLNNCGVYDVYKIQREPTRFIRLLVNTDCPSQSVLEIGLDLVDSMETHGSMTCANKRDACIRWPDSIWCTDPRLQYLCIDNYDNYVAGDTGANCHGVRLAVPRVPATRVEISGATKESTVYRAAFAMADFYRDGNGTGVQSLASTGWSEDWFVNE